MVLGGFECDADDVAAGHVAHIPVGVDAGKGEVAIFRVANEAVTADVVVVGVKEEMNLITGMLEFGSIVSAERTGTDDGVGSEIHGVFLARVRTKDGLAGKALVLPAFSRKNASHCCGEAV